MTKEFKPLSELEEKIGRLLYMLLMRFIKNWGRDCWRKFTKFASATFFKNGIRRKRQLGIPIVFDGITFLKD